MTRLLPGTTLELDVSRPEAAEQLMQALYMGGDLMLSQVCHISGLEPHVIQNWVARGYLAPPENKRYTQRQLCRILIIHMLRSILSLDLICRLLSYVNGHLDDESDDLVDDSKLYFWLVRLICSPETPNYDLLLADYQEPFPGARRRVEQVLQIMHTAYLSSQLKQDAEERIARLDAI